MYLRFVVSVRSGRGHVRRGLFRVLDRLRASARLDVDARRRADALVVWFNRHLAVPGDEAFNVDATLCWFKPGASEHLVRSRELLALYRAAGCNGLEIWNRDPGLVTYEDEAQIVARPRHGARAASY
jgi:hypothetical protein